MTAPRLAAILAADVVGYSRLMGEDEAGTGATHEASLKSGCLRAVTCTKS
jgi:class 3 adenylate cyclase